MKHDKNKYNPLVSQKTIDTYTCSICGYKHDNHREIIEHSKEHEFNDLKRIVNFFGSTADFEDKETAEYFLTFLLHERTRNQDWDDTFTQGIMWTGPGKYGDHYENTVDSYRGGNNTISTWIKLR